MPSIFLARLTSALAISVVPVIRRVTLEGFFSRLWRLPAFSRRILPEPVTRKRLLAPECVLFFGISFSLYSLLVWVVVSSSARARGPPRPPSGLRPRSRDRGSRSG